MYTEERLAALAGTTPDRIRLMSDLGIVTPGDDGYRPPDIQLGDEAPRDWRIGWPTP